MKGTNRIIKEKRTSCVDFSIAEVSRYAAREKSLRHGYPSTLRPLRIGRNLVKAAYGEEPHREENSMDRQPVSSSNIRSVGYEVETQMLELEFHSGGIYQYSGVPEVIYRDLIRAASKGSYFHQNIKDLYPFIRVR